MKIKIENFEGPLDLLLRLIEHEELDITQISLLSVTEQYINFLEQIEDKKPEMLADFLLIAAKLLYIKSKAVLPELEIETDDDSMDLAQQLKMYKKFIEASKIFNDLFTNVNYAYGRPLFTFKERMEFKLSKTLTRNKINKIFIEIINSLDVVKKIPQKTINKIISIKEKIRYIKELILKKEKFKFSELIQQSSNKTETIVSFLGLLELVKQRDIEAKQIDTFEEIIVTKINK